MSRNTTPRAAAVSVLIGLGLCAGGAQAAGYKAEIVRTQYGIPHVTAADYGSAGYGQAYAFLEDNLCLIADKIVSVNGERSKYFGPDGTTVVSFAETKNLDSDFFFKANLDRAALRKAFAATSPDYQALVRGYVAGYNRFLKDHPADKRPVACRGGVAAPLAAPGRPMPRTPELVLGDAVGRAPLWGVAAVATVATAGASNAARMLVATAIRAT